jgi:hypothetical protein
VTTSAAILLASSVRNAFRAVKRVATCAVCMGQKSVSEKWRRENGNEKSRNLQRRMPGVQGDD